jgi:hypothetical protein
MSFSFGRRVSLRGHSARRTGPRPSICGTWAPSTSGRVGECSRRRRSDATKWSATSTRIIRCGSIYYREVFLTDEDRGLVYFHGLATPAHFREIVRRLNGDLGRRQTRRALRSLIDRGAVVSEIRAVGKHERVRVYTATIPVERERDEMIVRRCAYGGGANTDEVISALCRRILLLEGQVADLEQGRGGSSPRPPARHSQIF